MSPQYIDPNYYFWVFRSQTPYDDPYHRNSDYNRYYGVAEIKEFPNYLICGLLCGKLEYEGVNVKSAKALPLKYIVNTDDMRRAYLLQFFIQKFVPDGGGRGGGYPVVYVVASINLVEEIVSFLLRNPDLYIDLVREFLPKSLFPNVNRGILEAHSLPTKGLVLENYTSGERIIVP